MYDRKRTGVDERSIKSKRLMNYGGEKKLRQLSGVEGRKAPNKTIIINTQSATDPGTGGGDTLPVNPF